MAQEEEEKSSFVVKDRRRFDASGNRRDDGSEEPAQKAAPQAQARPQPQAQPPPPPQSQPKRAAQPEPQMEMPDDEEMGDMPDMPEAAVDGEGQPLGFAELILSIATNAVMHLGGEQKDGRLPPRANLPLAAQHIDIISMLAQKTRGNLTKDESELLEGILYDLRMKYVQVAQALGR
jgi:hypothetical protein